METLLAKKILESDLKPDSVLTVDEENGDLTVTVTNGKTE